ncbi:MAG: hypothetical protein ACUVUG_06540 [Candidatus Aminicenantia bacterium]
MEVNVKEIMEKIRREIEEKRKGVEIGEAKKIEFEELKPWADHAEIRSLYEPILYGGVKKEETSPTEAPVPQTIPPKKSLKFILKKFFSIPKPWILRGLLFYLRPYIESRFEELTSHVVNLQRSMEYIKLLHNLSNNIVVEMSKLKVEVDSLRNRIITLENKMEFLEKRERLLEEKILNK